MGWSSGLACMVGVSRKNCAAAADATAPLRKALREFREAVPRLPIVVECVILDPHAAALNGISPLPQTAQKGWRRDSESAFLAGDGDGWARLDFLGCDHELGGRQLGAVP